jgi:hypothetical protein
MTLRQYLSVMLLGTVLAWAAAGVMLVRFDPFAVGPIAAGMLLLAVGVGTTGLAAVASALFRVFLLRRRGLVSRQVRVSFRQGAWIGFLLVLTLLLSHLRLFAWWNILLAVGAMTVAEYFFLISDPSRTAAEEEYRGT